MSDRPQEDVSEAARALADLQRARDEAAEDERRADMEYVANRIVEAIADGLDNRNFSRGWDETQAKDEAKERSPKVSSGNGQAKDEAKPLPVLRVLNPADWEGKKAPPRRWDVPDYIPHGAVALLYADGGTGKGYLGLQLAVARAVAKEWIGLLPEPGRTLVLSTEDDIDELWRRIEGMLPFFGARMADLGDIRLVDLVGENSVLGMLQKGIIEPTPMYDALDKYMADFKPGVAILDVLADLFSGEENNRAQVTQFIGLLKRLCRKHDCTILLSAQPSVAGMNTGSGTSGSTGWGNSGRARMYFQKVKLQDGTEPNKDLRTFEGMKNNYGERGGKFDLVFERGLFRRAAGPSGFDKMAREQKLDERFLTLLKRLSLQNRPVRATNSKSGAPSLFAAEPDNGGFSSKDFEAAMLRLLSNGKIANEPDSEAPPSKQINRLVIKGK
jgi:RecA-family ATPase